MRFLAASMPRRRRDGGQLVLPVWSTWSCLFLGICNIFFSFPTFWIFWSDFVQNLVETYPDSGAENWWFWVPVLGTRSGGQNWVTNTRFINNPCIWGQPGVQNWDQKRCPKLGTKMVTKCSPPAKKDRPAGEEIVKIIAQSWDQKQLPKHA